MEVEPLNAVELSMIDNLANGTYKSDNEWIKAFDHIKSRVRVVNTEFRKIKNEVNNLRDLKDLK